uniref:hypothetical protein n=1 Tax=Marinagarivorans algicola TaxID=1513270 RepID=UPI0006B49C46
MLPINDNIFRLLDNAGVFDSRNQGIFNEFSDLAQTVTDAAGGPESAAKFLNSISKISNANSDGSTAAEKAEAAFASLGFIYGTAQLITSSAGRSTAFDLVYKKVPILGTALTGTSLAINTTRVIDSALTPGQAVNTSDLLGAASDITGMAAIAVGAAAVVFGIAGAPLIIAGLTAASIGLGIWGIVESLGDQVEDELDEGSDDGVIVGGGT